MDSTNSTQIRLARQSPAYWRVTMDNPPINVMGPETVRQFQETIHAIEGDEQLRVVVFDSAVEGYLGVALILITPPRGCAFAQATA
jgi:enoyl-CoA hydratase/carnithine racemase